MNSSDRFKIMFEAAFLIIPLVSLVVFLVSLIDRRWGLPGRPRPQQSQSTRSIAVQSLIVTAFLMLLAIIWLLVKPLVTMALSWITGAISQ
jgi:hypothetical protein